MISDVFVINMSNSKIQDEHVNEVVTLEGTLEYAILSEKIEKNGKTSRDNGG